MTSPSLAAERREVGSGVGLAIAAIAIVVGALLRWPALEQDLWFDEVWALQEASGFRSVFEAFRPDIANHHVLNVMWMYVLGDRASALAYRLPSWIAGVLTVALSFRCGARERPGFGWLYALVFAVSFPLLAYAAEARGYALSVLFALAAYQLFGAAALPSLGRAALIWACVVLGFLAHFSFGYFYAAFGLWSAFRCWRLHGASVQAVRALAVLHGVPALAVLALLPLMLAGVRDAVGHDFSYPAVITQAMAWGLSLPVAFGGVVLALLAAVLIAGDARARMRAGDDSWLFFPLVIAVVPLAVTALTRNQHFAARYLLVSVAFCSLAVSATLARAFARSRWLGAGGLVLVLTANLVQLAPFLADGRGHYADAVRYLAAHTRGEQIVVASDHDTRNVRLLAYYERLVPRAKQIVYVPQPEIARRPPQWLIVHSFEQPPSAPAAVATAGATYAMKQVFPYWGPSGFHWFVYERR